MLAEAANAASNIRSQIVADLHQAAAATGSDFDYLLSTATRESSLKPQAKATASSAAGLFQFVGQTWLGLVKQYGAKYGLGSYADRITRNGDGSYRVDNSADRRAILALRNDPQISAYMAGEYAKATRSQLQASLGRNVNNGELYAAHFLGEGAACRLIRMNSSNPNACAAAEFPEAAQANRSIFYHANGTPKTVREVYNWAQQTPDCGSAGDGTWTDATSQAPAAPSYNYSLPVTDDGAGDATASIGVMPSSGSCTIVPMKSLGQAPFALTAAVIDLFTHSQDAAQKPQQVTAAQRAHARTHVDLALVS